MTEIAKELNGYKLLTVSVRTGSAEIFLIDPSDGSATNLTRHPGCSNRYPSWSPNGEKIAFTSDRDGTYDLYLMNADGSEVRRLTHKQTPSVAYLPAWSAYGNMIVFGLHGDEPLICSVAPDGSQFRIIGRGHDPNVSPNGKLIAYTDHANKGYVLLLMDSDGSNVRQITSHENEIGAVTPTFSPDGRRILYSDTVNGALEIFSIDPAGNDNRQLTRFGKMATSPAWSPDMRWISFRLTDEPFWIDPQRSKTVYAENRADKRPVWVMRPDGSDAHPIESLRYQAGIDGSRTVWHPGAYR